MKKIITWLLPAALVALGLLARALATEAWTSFTRYPTPFAFTNPGALACPPLVERVIIVLVDGLGQAVSREMPYLNTLRDRGADFECRIGVPSFSLPGRAVILTGAWQEIHGQATNFNPRQLPVEHLFLTAKKKGLTTALAAFHDTHTLLAPSVDEAVVYPEEPGGRGLEALRQEQTRMAAMSRRLLAEKTPQLAQLELHMPDDAGHAWGASSPQYRQAALAADEEIRGLAQLVDLSRSVLVVTADHGHTAKGGHGGPEESVLRVPLVMAGGPVAAGTKGSCLQVDIAPTVAALLGTEIPASNVGHPLLAAFQLDGAERVQILQSLHQQRENFVGRYVARIGPSLEGGMTAANPQTVAVPARPDRDQTGGGAGDPEREWAARIAALDSTQRRAQEARIQRERNSRLPISLLFLIPLPLLLCLRLLGCTTTGELGAALLAALLALVLYRTFFPVVGLEYSFSAMNKDEELEPFFRKDMFLGVTSAGLAVGLASAGVVVVRRRRRVATSAMDLARLAWLTAAGIAALFLIRVGYVFWRWGAFLRWYMPDPVWGFGFYLDVLVVMALGFSAPLLPVMAFAGGWLGRRLESGAEAR